MLVSYSLLSIGFPKTIRLKIGSYYYSMQNTFRNVFRAALVLFLFLFGVGMVYLFNKEAFGLSQEDFIISALLAGISGLVSMILILILRFMTRTSSN